MNPEEGRTIARQAMLTSGLSAVLFALQGPGLWFRGLAVLLAVVTLLVARRLASAPAARLAVAVVVLQGVQLLLFLSAFAAMVPPFRYRILQAALLLAFLASAATALVALNRPDYPRRMIRVIWTLAGLLGVGELVLRVSAAPVTPPDAPSWSGIGTAHPRLGTVNPPDTTVLSFYAANPEGYFAPVDLRQWHARLGLSGGSVARAEYPADRPDVTRIAISQAPGDTLWHIQYILGGLAVDSGHSYLVEFRARADTPRPLNLNVTQAHEPWTWLGLYRDYALRPEWQTFRETFVVPAAEADAGLFFNFGGSAVSAELADIRLRSLPDSQPVTPPAPPRPFQVAYRFNAEGCRDDVVTVPRPARVRRVLLLGDEQVLGLGLHEDDTFARLVERDSSARGIELINCGVAGYSTWDERLFYELIGHRLEADLVLLVATPGDDLSYAEQVRRGYVGRQPAKLESLLATWGAVQRFRHRRRAFQYSASVRQILELDRLARERGATVVVGLFPGSEPADSGRLAGALHEGLRETEIPVLELGPSSETDSLSTRRRTREAHRLAAERLAAFLREHRWPDRR
jgi:hypothetical protein